MQAYTVEQVAEMLHIGRDKVYHLLRTGQLHSIKIPIVSASHWVPDGILTSGLAVTFR